jgi:alpha-1,3-rhamnosyl/mannosyltransferase
MFPEAEDRCRVIPNGVKPPSASEPQVGHPANDGRPYVLFLGTLEPRKNVERLVRAMEAIWDRRPGFPDLVLAGGDGWGLPGFGARLASSRHAARIRRVGYVAPEDSTGLVRGARLLAYPSLYEGFGLPPLEAMALGTVVVASSSSSLPEVIGDAGLMPDPEDVGCIAAALERAEDDDPWRELARERGLLRAAGYSWSLCAASTRAVFEEALD